MHLETQIHQKQETNSPVGVKSKAQITICEVFLFTLDCSQIFNFFPKEIPYLITVFIYALHFSGNYICCAGGVWSEEGGQELGATT